MCILTQIRKVKEKKNTEFLEFTTADRTGTNMEIIVRPFSIYLSSGTTIL